MRDLAIGQAQYLPLGAMSALIGIALRLPVTAPEQNGADAGPAGWSGTVRLDVERNRHHCLQPGAAGLGRRFALTALTSVLFGVAMFSNGVFTTGSPLHGMYAVGIFSILTPLLFQVALGADAPPRMAWLAPATSLLGMACLWLMMSGLLRWLQHRNGGRHAT